VRNQLVYVPTVTREPFRYRGRITSLIETGELFESIGLPPLDPADDRVMIAAVPPCWPNRVRCWTRAGSA